MTVQSAASEGPGLGLQFLSVILALAVAGANAAEGAEAPGASALFVLVFLLVALIMLMLTQARAVTPGMAVVALIGAAWVGAGRAGEWYQATPEVLQLAGAGAVFVSAHAIGRSTRLTETAWRVLVWALLLFVIVALSAYVSDYALHPDQASHNGTHRLRAAFVSPNVAATLFGLCALIGTSRAASILHHPAPGVASRSDLLDYFFHNAFPAFALASLSVTALVLTASRAGIGLGLGILLILSATEWRALWRRRHPSRRHARHRRLVPGLIGGLLLALLVSNTLLWTRASQLGEDAGGRLSMYRIYWEAWQSQPWFGAGLGSFNRVNDALMTLSNVHLTLPVGAAHNVVLQWLVQQGVAGLGLMSLIIAAIHVPILSKLARHGTGSRSLLRLAVCASGLVIAHGMVDYALELPSIVWTWSFILGLAHGRSAILRQA